MELPFSTALRLLQYPQKLIELAESEERTTQGQVPNEVRNDNEGFPNQNSKATEMPNDWLADGPRSYIKEPIEDY